MKILHNLYRDFNNIKSIITIFSTTDESCLQYCTKCTELYRTVAQYCSLSRSSRFCIALKAFKDKYDEIYNSSLSTNLKNERLELIASENIILGESMQLQRENTQTFPPTVVSQ